jgi:hypothetical protein
LNLAIPRLAIAPCTLPVPTLGRIASLRLLDLRCLVQPALLADQFDAITLSLA